jgi:tripartite ATP-independent transporter DctM subunit
MSPEMIGIIGILLLLVLMLLRVSVGISLLLVGTCGYLSVTNMRVGMSQLGMSPFATASDYNLSVMPMFILMGMFLSYSGLGKELFKAVDTWVGHVRGGIAMATIGASAIFSSISGSIIATTATMAKVSLPEMEKYEYHAKISTSSIAAGGTLGILIPPSVILILYGVLTMENIGDLLIAGLIPGILMALTFMISIYIQIRRNPSLAPRQADPKKIIQKIKSLKLVWPFLLIFLISIGGIYMGVFTPTEAGGVGAMGAFLFTLFTRRLDWKKLKESLDETIRITAMIFLILIGATVFSKFLAITQIPMQFAGYVTGLDLSPYLILFLILLTYLILGFFMEGIAVLVLTMPIIYPLIIELGFSGIWFGVIMVMALNMGNLTPPLGISVYVISGIAKHIPIQTIFRGVMPMLLTMIIFTILLVIFPEIVTFLPDLMKNR